MTEDSNPSADSIETDEADNKITRRSALIGGAAMTPLFLPFGSSDSLGMFDNFWVADNGDDIVIDPDQLNFADGLSVSETDDGVDIKLSEGGSDVSSGSDSTTGLSLARTKVSEDQEGNPIEVVEVEDGILGVEVGIDFIDDDGSILDPRGVVQNIDLYPVNPMEDAPYTLTGIEKSVMLGDGQDPALYGENQLASLENDDVYEITVICIVDGAYEPGDTVELYITYDSSYPEPTIIQPTQGGDNGDIS